MGSVKHAGSGTTDPTLVTHSHVLADVTNLESELGARFKDVTLTQAEYDALATKDPNTSYWITG